MTSFSVCKQFANNSDAVLAAVKVTKLTVNRSSRSRGRYVQWDRIPSIRWNRGYSCPIGHDDLGLLFAFNIVTSTVTRTASELLANCLQTENDVKPFSPLGGIALEIKLWILKGRPRLTISG